MCIDDVQIPKYSLAEELLNAISHGIGALLGIAALVICAIIFIVFDKFIPK